MSAVECIQPAEFASRRDRTVAALNNAVSLVLAGESGIENTDETHIAIGRADRVSIIPIEGINGKRFQSVRNAIA